MDTTHYDFSDHIDSIEWIDSLPKGLLSERIDTRYNTVTITPIADGYQIYVGPKDMESGGDGLLVTLDKAYQLTGYEIERIEPFPF